MDISDLDLPRDAQGFLYLRKKYSELYQKSSYLTKQNVIVNRIFEYDIKAANISALKQEGFDSTILEKLLKLEKREREVAVGKMIAQDAKIGKIIKKHIKHARELLFKYNNLQDDVILSIKNDAVFIIGTNPTVTKFNEMEFRLKNQYAAFIQFDGLEFYYNKRKSKLDIKGVSDDVINTKDHQTGIILFICKVMNYLVMDRLDSLRKYLIEFTHLYKARELPVQYYRELNSFNIYRTIYELSGYSFNLLIADQSDVKTLNIQFNYNRYVLPLIHMFI